MICETLNFIEPATQGTSNTIRVFFTVEDGTQTIVAEALLVNGLAIRPRLEAKCAELGVTLLSWIPDVNLDW